MTADGRPAASASVSARRIREPSEPDGNAWAESHATADAHRVAHLRGLDPKARYDVEARPFVSGELTVEVALGTLSAWTPHDATITLGVRQTTRGVVVDLGGRPVAHACVVRLDEST